MIGAEWGVSVLIVIGAAIAIGEVIRAANPAIGFVFALVGIAVLLAGPWIVALLGCLVDGGVPAPRFRLQGSIGRRPASSEAASERKGTPAPSDDQHVPSGAIPQATGGS